MIQIRQNCFVLALGWEGFCMKTIQQHRRLSIRATAIKYGLPPRVVSRAIWCGELSAIKTTTETGRERIYILVDDADRWFESLALPMEGGSE